MCDKTLMVRDIIYMVMKIPGGAVHTGPTPTTNTTTYLQHLRYAHAFVRCGCVLPVIEYYALRHICEIVAFEFDWLFREFPEEEKGVEFPRKIAILADCKTIIVYIPRGALRKSVRRTRGHKGRQVWVVWTYISMQIYENTWLHEIGESVYAFVLVCVFLWVWVFECGYLCVLCAANTPT